MPQRVLGSDALPPSHPSLGLSTDPEVTEQKKLWCISIHFENRYTIGPERGDTTEASDPEKEKWRISNVVVYIYIYICAT